MKRIHIGEFEITSEGAVISDPCYEPGTWCAAVLNKVMIGTWTAYVISLENGRVDKLLAFFGQSERASSWQVIPETIGVDSGQCGIFDSRHYQDDSVVMTVERMGPEIIREEEPWYSICCDRTINTEHSAGVIPFGCVSSSGYGDGSYRCEIQKDIEGYVVGIQVTFITDVETED